MASNDPFTAAQADVLELLEQTRPLLSSYLRIRSSASSSSTPELIEARRELESTLTELRADLQDLVDSVKAVEGDPYRYGLDVAEVARRRKLVADVGDEVEDLHRQLNNTVQAVDSRAGLADPDSFGNLDAEDQDDGYEAWEEQRQMQIMHEQDEALDGVFQTVGNLRAQADTMGRELEEQADLLEDTENITDRVQGKLQTGMKKIRYVIEQNEEAHPLLQQTPLTVNPFIDLPKAPTLPHNYVSLPATLPPSMLNAAPAPSNPALPAYVTSASGFAAHPSTIIAQNKALLEQVAQQRRDAETRVAAWEKDIRDRELAEKRRKAPGWLDSDDRLLEPAKAAAAAAEGDTRPGSKLMDAPSRGKSPVMKKDKDVDDLGAAMDRAFGPSEVG